LAAMIGLSRHLGSRCSLVLVLEQYFGPLSLAVAFVLSNTVLDVWQKLSGS